MFSGKNQSGQAPTAFGSMLQASTYGMTIPVIYGRTISPALVTWANNLRQGGSTKKFKQLKKGITAYCENITMLLGKNPMLGTLQFYVNNSKYPLNFVKYSQDRGLLHKLPVGNVGGSPDPNFYSVIGVTITQTYSQTFNDYGGSGPQTLTGSYETPLWNELIAGPDPTGPSGYRNSPLCYRWEPGYGPYIYIDAFVGPTINIYYAQLSSATLPDTPLSKLRLHWEARLGDGDEYSGFSSEQIIYDDYAGIGSASLDLGSSGTIPSIKPESQGKFSIYPSGDCDFVDIIEDIIKSGITQAAVGGSVGFGATQHGVACYDLPGCIQMKYIADSEEFTNGPILYDLPVTAGNFLVVVATTDGTDGHPVSISDTLGNTWTPAFGGSPNNQVWYAKANASGVCTVTVGGQGFDWSTMLLEVAGVDTFDSVSIGANATASITTTNAPGFPGYLLSIGLYAVVSTTFAQPNVANWEVLTAQNYRGFQPPGYSIQQRTVSSPGTYSISIDPSATAQCILAFKCVQPPSYPKPLLDFLDQPSADLTRLQCRAAGLWGSLAMTSQKAASEWIGDLVTAADCAPVYSGFRLKLIPRSEVSAVGNGAVYIAPTASGPVANLDADLGDFLAPIQCVRTARTDLDTVLQMQHLNRNSDYQQVVTAEADPASIALYGVRKKDPIVNNAIQDVAVAQPILRIMTRRQNYVDLLAYKFKLNARWGLLEAMDLVTITDRQQGILQIPVRLKSVIEDDKFENDCEAEPFIYGISAPQTIAVTEPTSYRGGGGFTQPVGQGINPPIIFEPTPRLSRQTSPAQIWCVTSCAAANYGGCIPYISTDGGLSYTPASPTPVVGSATQGLLTSEWPAASDPDTTNNLFVGFNNTVPTATLLSYSATQRDKFQYPCYVGWSSIATAIANFTAGNTSQITSLGALFSNPTMTSTLPSDAVIVNIFPVIIVEAATADPTAVSQGFTGTGLTPTSGGTSFSGPTSGVINPPLYNYDAAGIGTSLTGQEIRYAFSLPTNGGAASVGQVTGVGWAVYYTSATPNVDRTLPLPFNDPPPSGHGWAWAMPKTVATGTVGTGSNATVSAFGGIAPSGIGYEIMTYNQATLVSAGNYELMATGTGNELRRGVYGAPSPGVGMDHPPGSQFALLDPGDTGICKINLDPIWIGTQLFFKFPTFNSFGGALQPLADADVYSYTPTGIAGNIGPAAGGFLVEGS